MRALLPLTLGLLQACASFEAGALPHLERWPPAAARAGAASTLTVTLEGLPGKFEAGWRKALTRALGEVDGLRFVVGEAASSEARSLAVSVTHRRQPLPVSRAWMAACALTAGVVPARARHAFDVRAVARDAAGRELCVVERRVASSTWVGWLLLPAMPFAGVGMTGLAEDTFRSVLGEVAAEGWL